MGTDEARSAQLYLDGQPFDGIKEIELEPTPDDESAESLRTADTLTLELTLTPEQAAAIVAAAKPVIDKAIDTIVQALREFTDWAADVLRKVAAATAKTASDLVDSLLYTANEHPKWWHLYKHAKKARTRKKYRRRLMQQLLRKLEAAAVT